MTTKSEAHSDYGVCAPGFILSARTPAGCAWTSDHCCFSPDESGAVGVWPRPAAAVGVDVNAAVLAPAFAA